MVLKFEFKKEKSSLFGTVHRPIAQVFLKHLKQEKWRPVTMIVDTGADYTMLPYWYAPTLGIDLVKDCKLGETSGVGGSEEVFIYKYKLPARLGNWEREIPVGFIGRDNIPPLLGREDFLDTFAVLFFDQKTSFALKPSELF